MRPLASYQDRAEWLIPQPDLGRAQLLWKHFNFLQPKNKANVSFIKILKETVIRKIAQNILR